jgi:2'-hydroxyisoflavone reductase
MRLLVIGGTSFLGRATVEEALRRGESVTTFNRGQSGPDVPGVAALRGDRSSDTDLAQLAGREFDAVVDTCGFVPEVVGRSAAVLSRGRSADAFYAFVSSMSATTTWPHSPTPDDAPGQACPADAGPDAGDYGKLKAGCERAVTDVYGDRALVVRAGLILGPHENVSRLPWWLQRVARGGEVLAPGDPDVRMQLVDARDLAAFMLGCAQRGTGGTVNATGPQGNATMRGWLEDCVDVTGSDATLTWVPDDLLLEHRVEVWTELPLWMAPGQEADHVWSAETGKAQRLGLRSRPVAETVADTWAWLRDEGPAAKPDRDYVADHGIDPEKEQRILAAHHARGS